MIQLRQALLDFLLWVRILQHRKGI